MLPEPKPKTCSISIWCRPDGRNLNSSSLGIRVDALKKHHCIGSSITTEMSWSANGKIYLKIATQALRREVLEAFDAYLNCGILLHGCARAYCEKCGHSELIAFSCKRRGLCPSCDTLHLLVCLRQNGKD